MSNKIYIAGPMSGIPEFNFPAFNAAAEMWRKMEFEVFNPAEKAEESDLDEQAYLEGNAEVAKAEGFNFRDAYAWDVLSVINADAIYMLKGWEKSPGARGEHAVAVAMQRHYPEYQIYYE